MVILSVFAIFNYFVTKKEGNAHKTPTSIRLTSLDPITYTPSHELSAVSLTCYDSRITVQNHTMQLPITQMVRPNLMCHTQKLFGLWPQIEHLQCTCTARHHGQTPFDFTNQLLVFYFTENTPTTQASKPLPSSNLFNYS